VTNPIYVSAAGQGSTTVEVGIKSKAFQAGPIVRRHHRKYLENLRGLFGIS
jgi:hypothetical protein